MKKKILIFLGLIAMMLLFSSCTPPEDEGTTTTTSTTTTTTTTTSTTTTTIIIIPTTTTTTTTLPPPACNTFNSTACPSYCGKCSDGRCMDPWAECCSCDTGEKCVTDPHKLAYATCGPSCTCEYPDICCTYGEICNGSSHVCEACCTGSSGCENYWTEGACWGNLACSWREVC